MLLSSTALQTGFETERQALRKQKSMIRYVTQGPSKAKIRTSIVLLYKYGEVDKETSLDQSYQKQNSSDIIFNTTVVE